jgi:hypothetical protein
MRTLPTRAVGDWITFPDTDDPDCIWVIRARPVPLGEVSLVRWHQPNGPADGRLLLEVGVGPTTEDLVSLSAATGAPRVRALPLAGARVHLAVEADRVVGAATALDDRVVVALDVPALPAERLEAVVAGTGSFPIRVTWEMTTWVQLPGGAVEVSADEAVIGPLLDGGHAPPGLAGALTITWSGAGLAPELLLDWAWAELRARRTAGLPLAFRSVSSSLIALPITLSAGLDALGALRVQHVDLAAEGGLLRRRFEVRVAGDPARAGWRAVEARLTLDGVARFAAAAPVASWELPGEGAATWSWRAVADVAGSWAPEQPAEGIGWIAVPTDTTRELVISAVGLDLATRWERVEVTVDGATVILDRGAPTVRLATRGRSARATFAAYGGAVRTAAWDDVGDVLILVDPEHGSREVLVVPSGAGWTGDTAVYIDAELLEGGWPRTTARMEPTGARFTIAGPGPWRWRAHIRTPEGRYERGEWLEETGTIATFMLSSPTGVRLRLLPVWFDASWRSVRLSVTPTGGTNVAREITSAAPVDLLLDGALPAAWGAVWTRLDGSEVTREGIAAVPVVVLGKP